MPQSHARRQARVGPQIRARRLAAGFTQAELAHRIGAADATLSRIERGKYSPSPAMLEAIAGAIGCSVAELYEPKAKPSPEPSLRPAQARLLVATEKLSDAEIDDVTRAVKILITVGRRSVGRPPPPP